MTHFPTPQERRALGRARRKQLARQEHSQWKPESRRRGPLELMQESMRGRVPQLITLKYDRMVASPFGFFRGAVPVMAYDLSPGPNTGIFTQTLRRRARPQPRRLRRARRPPRLRHQRLRRDHPRPLRVGRQAAGHQPHPRRPRPGAKKSACRDAALAFLERYRKMHRLFARMPVPELARYQVHRLQRISPSRRRF